MKRNLDLENFLVSLLTQHGSLEIRKIEGYIYISDLPKARYWDHFDVLDSLRNLRLAGRVKYDHYPHYSYRMINWGESSDCEILNVEM